MIYKGLDLILIDELFKNMTHDYDCYYPELCAFHDKEIMNSIYFNFVKEEQRKGERFYEIKDIQDFIDKSILTPIFIDKQQSIFPTDSYYNSISFEYDPFEECDGEACGGERDGHGHLGMSTSIIIDVTEGSSKRYFENLGFMIKNIKEDSIENLLLIFDMMKMYEKTRPEIPEFISHVNTIKRHIK